MMNELTTMTATETMSSLEIAELVDKQHSHILRDIRIMLAELYGEDYVNANIPANKRNRHKEWIGNNAGAILASIMGEANPNQDLIDSKGFCPKRDAQGRVCEFLLNKKLTLTLTSGYKTKQRAAIIDRWMELEAKQHTDLSTLSPILQVAIKLEQEQLRLAAVQKAQADRISAIEDRQDLMDGDTGYQTVMAWCRVNSIKLSLGEANAFGRRCSSYCKKHGITTGKVPDERFGTVKSYPVEVLNEVFDA